MGGNGDFAEKNTLHECAAIVIAKGFANHAMAVDRAGDPGICSANHGKLGLRASENGILQVLRGSCAFEEPSIIGNHNKKLGALESEVAGEIAKVAAELVAQPHMARAGIGERGGACAKGALQFVGGECLERGGPCDEKHRHGDKASAASDGIDKARDKGGKDQEEGKVGGDFEHISSGGR